MSVTADAVRAGQASPEPASSLGHSVTIANAGGIEDDYDDPMTLGEAETAFDELHGCFIRRPGDVCGVRKEYLATALAALDEKIRSMKAPDADADAAARDAALPGDAPVTLADGFGAEQDEDTFTIRFPDGHALTAWADGRLFVSNATAGFAPFGTSLAALTPSAQPDDLRARLHEEG